MLMVYDSVLSLKSHLFEKPATGMPMEFDPPSINEAPRVQERRAMNLCTDTLRGLVIVRLRPGGVKQKGTPTFALVLALIRFPSCALRLARHRSTVLR